MVDSTELTQDAFAISAGLSRAWVQQKMKPGEQRMDRASLRKLSAFLHKSPPEVVGMLKANGTEHAAPESKAVRVLADLSALVASGALTTGKVLEVTERAAADHNAKERANLEKKKRERRRE